MAVSPGYLSSIRDRVPQSQRAPKSPYVQSLSETVFAADLDMHNQTNMADGELQKKKPLVGMEALTGRMVTPDSSPEEIQPYIDSGWLPRVPTTEDIQWLSDRLYQYKAITHGENYRGALPSDPSKIPSGIHPAAKAGNAQDIGATVAQSYGKPSTGTEEELDPYARAATWNAQSPNPERNKPKPEPAVAGVNQEGLPDEAVTAPQQQDPTAHSGSSGYGGGQGQYVGAHSVALADPDSQAALQQGFTDEENARLAGGAIAANAQDVAGRGQEDAARQNAADLDQIAQNQSARQEYLDKISSGIEEDSRAMAQATVDPDRLWHNKSTGAKIISLIGLFCGGFVSAQKGGPNHAADQLQAAIQNDISAQRAGIENKWSSLRGRHSLLQEKAAQFGSLEIAERQQVASRLNGAMLMTQAMASRASSPLERANAAALAAQLEQKAVEASIQLNKFVTAGYVGGGGLGASGFTKDIKQDTLVYMPNGQLVDAGSPAKAAMIDGQNQAAEHVIGQADQLINLMHDPDIRNPLSHYFTPKLGQIQTLKKEITMDDLRAATGGNNGRAQGLMMWLNEAVGDSTSPWKFKAAQSEASLNKFKQKVTDDTNLRGHELNGNAVVEHVVDPSTQQSKLRIVGRYQHGGGTLGATGATGQAPPASSLRLQKAGQ